VNPERTPLTENATVSLRETAARALPDLLQRLPELLD
jgi:NAD-dependent deacetylase